MAHEVERRSKEIEDLRLKTTRQVEEIQKCTDQTLKTKQHQETFKTQNLQTAQHVQDILKGRQTDIYAKKTSLQSDVQAMKT